MRHHHIVGYSNSLFMIFGDFMVSLGCGPKSMDKKLPGAKIVTRFNALYPTLKWSVRGVSNYWHSASLVPRAPHESGPGLDPDLRRKYLPPKKSDSDSDSDSRPGKYSYSRVRVRRVYTREYLPILVIKILYFVTLQSRHTCVLVNYVVIVILP